MRPGRYIISHSSADLISTLNHYEKFRGEYDVKILVSSTFENYQFLQSVGIPASALEYLQYPSQSCRLRQLFRYLRSLWSEKERLKRLADEMVRNPGAELIFHSWHMDTHAAYLASRVARTHKVTLVDALPLESAPIRWRDLVSKSGIKVLLGFVVFSLVFGPIFFISGSSDYQFVCMDIRRLPIDVKPRSAGGTPESLWRYLYKPPLEGKTACLTYRDRWGIDQARHVAIYQSIVEALVRAGYQILLKVHPQSAPPSFLERYGVHHVPKYVPFELVDLSRVSLVAGLAGASLLSTGNVPTVCFLNMAFEEHSGHYEWEMALLRGSKSIQFVRSADEFEQVIRRL